MTFRQQILNAANRLAALPRRPAVLARAREHSWPITISMGVANYSIPAASITDMMSAADQLMYRAKQSGKNRIIHESVEIPINSDFRGAFLN
jgi:diguanylate cyclase (GGDEF)-like protein